MHRTTTRSSESDDDQRSTQPSQRSDVSSGQQSVLDLQQGVGNSLTGQIVQRSPQVIRRAGDKLAFERADDVPEQDGLAVAVKDVIERHRKAKRIKKDEIEDWREGEIARSDDASHQKKAEIAGKKSQGLPEDLVELLGTQNEAATIGKHKKTLGDYHDRVEKESGWHWTELEKDLRRIETVTLQGTALEGHVRVYGGESSKLIYHVYFGRNRFRQDPDQARVDTAPNVFTKRGHDHGDKSKEFVDDDNGVKTRRFVTRAVTIWHLASMFGLNLKPIKNTDDANVEKAFDETTKERVNAQMARYNGKDFAGHRDTFRLWDAASVAGESGHGGTEFRANYRPREVLGGRVDEHYEPMRKGKKTDLDFTTGYERWRHDDMGLNERASMQVRNGSGEFQPFLSTASIQIDPTGQRKQKIIRANKGERFDTGAENQATVKVDLSAAKREGVEIVNQHDDESHQHKIAWDRFYGKDDIEDLAKRFALARKYRGTEYASYVEGIEPTEKELEVFDRLDQASIRKNKPEDVYRKKYIKREAPDELDEYIYSARKNREVLMQKIPITCVTEINFNGDLGKWDGLDVTRGVWHEFTPQLQSKLKVYLRGSEDESQEDYTNIKKMFTKAAVDKKAEGGTRT
jgi:hypothetical protein